MTKKSSGKDMIEEARRALYKLSSHYRTKAAFYQALASSIEKLRVDKIKEIIEEASEILDSELEILRFREPEKVTFT